MRHQSIKLDSPVEFINITPLNPLISKCEIKVCYVSDEPNRNGSVITKEIAKQIANSLPGSPVVGFHNETAQDFEEHNREISFSDEDGIRIIDTTRPYGFVDLNAKVWFQKFLDDGVNEREYLMTEGYLWTGQYPECQRIIEQGNNQSMEFDPDTLKGSWTKDENGNCQFFIINEAIISKLCILGDDYEPCFEGATITTPTIQFSFDDKFKNELFSMMNELKEFLQEGGKQMPTNVETEQLEVTTEETVETETEATEVETEFKDKEVKSDMDETEDKTEEEKCPECGKPLDECTCEKDEEDKEKAKYSLDEIPEYVALQTQYSDLESRYNALVAEMETTKTQLTELNEFKLKADRREKEEMINKFYMLDEEDKKDVRDNIDTYSLNDIEAKLSILCVRNKVSFDNKPEENSGATVYVLDNCQDDTDMPEWVKATLRVEKAMK